MTLVEATRELRRLSGDVHVAIKAEAVIGRLGEKLEVSWYASGERWSDDFPSIEACVADFRRWFSPERTMVTTDVEVGDAS